jgi:hypothetical protein
MKQLIIIAMLCLSFSMVKAQASANESLELSNADKQISNQFKSSKGGDRTSAFAALKNLINVKGAINGAVTSSTRIGAKTTTLSQVIALLGEPDSKIQHTIIQYNLKTSTSECKAVIGVNSNNEVVFCTIKDCN